MRITVPSGTAPAVDELGGDVQVAVGTLLHVADADVQRSQQHFPLLRLLRLGVIERHAPQRLPVQRSEKRAALPALEPIARVEDQARRADYRVPEHPRVVHAFPGPRVIRHGRAGVVAARRHQRPPVVVAGKQDVDLVAAQWADFGFPQLAGFGVIRQAVRIPMAVAEDLRQRACAPDERIVRRNAAVVTDAQDLAVVVVECLRLHPLAVVLRSVAAVAVAVADGHIQGAVAPEQHAARVRAVALPGVRDEDFLEVHERVARELAAADGNRVAARPVFRVRQIDQPILRKAWMQRDEMQRVGRVVRRRGPGRRGRRFPRGLAASSTPSWMIRSRPERSATRIVCESGNARLYGCTSPPATCVTLIRWPVAVSATSGARAAAAVGVGGACAITAGGKRSSAASVAAREGNSDAIMRPRLVSCNHGS